MIYKNNYNMNLDFMILRFIFWFLDLNFELTILIAIKCTAY